MSDIRRTINDIIDDALAGRIPMPYSFEPDAALGTVDVTWMEQENAEGSKKLIDYAPDWTVNALSTSRDPILEREDERGAMRAWVHPDVVSLTVSVKVKS